MLATASSGPSRPLVRRERKRSLPSRAILVLRGHKAMLDATRRLDRLEAKTNAKFTTVFEAIRQLMAPPEPKNRPIGFVAAKGK